MKPDVTKTSLTDLLKYYAKIDNNKRFCLGCESWQEWESKRNLCPECRLKRNKFACWKYPFDKINKK